MAKKTDLAVGEAKARKASVSKDLTALLVLERMGIGTDSANRLAIVKALRDEGLF